MSAITDIAGTENVLLSVGRGRGRLDLNIYKSAGYVAITSGRGYTGRGHPRTTPEHLNAGTGRSSGARCRVRERNGLVMWFGGSLFRTTQTRYGLFGARRGAALWHHPLVHIGVTLIEMLIVIAIIGTILAIALPMFQSVLDQARVARAIGDISALQTDIAAYEAGGKGLPESLATIGRASLVDPWGSPYQYLNFAGEDDEDKKGKGKGKFPVGARMDRFLVPINSTFDLYSMGKDGTSVPALTAKNSKDDIVRANDGGFIGLAVKY